MQFATLPCTGTILSYAQRCMLRAQHEGAVPANRKPLSGNETAIVARFATQDGFINRGIVVFREPTPNLLWIDLLYVEHEFRRQNIGWLLLSEARNFASHQRFREVSLGTLAKNAPMRSLMARAPGLFHAENDPARNAIIFTERLARRAAR